MLIYSKELTIVHSIENGSSIKILRIHNIGKISRNTYIIACFLILSTYAQVRNEEKHIIFKPYSNE